MDLFGPLHTRQPPENSLDLIDGPESACRGILLTIPVCPAAGDPDSACRGSLSTILVCPASGDPNSACRGSLSTILVCPASGDPNSACRGSLSLLIRILHEKNTVRAPLQPQNSSSRRHIHAQRNLRPVTVPRLFLECPVDPCPFQHGRLGRWSGLRAQRPAPQQELDETAHRYSNDVILILHCAGASLRIEQPFLIKTL